MRKQIHPMHIVGGLVLIAIGLLLLNYFGISGSRIATKTETDRAVIVVPNSLGTEISSQNILVLVNYQRMSYELKPLKANDRLSQAALLKLKDMRRNGYLSRKGVGGEYVDYWVDKARYGYSIIPTDNLAKGASTVQELVSVWMGSDIERQLILNPLYTETGIATDGDFVIQIYAAPL